MSKWMEGVPDEPGTYLVALDNESKVTIRKLFWDGVDWENTASLTDLFGPVTKWKKSERHND